MRKAVFALLFLSLFLYAKVESQDMESKIEKYDTIFKKIDKKRVGLSDIDVSRIPLPFVSRRVYLVLKERNITLPKPVVLKLYGIFNKKVKINTKWYKTGSKLFGYRVVKIKDNSVVLKGKGKRLELFLRKRDGNIQISKNN